MVAPDIRIVDATLEHALELAGNVRPADAAEVMASHGFSSKDALLVSMSVSLISKTLLVDGKVAAVFGLAPLEADPRVGQPWLLTSEIITRMPGEFFRLSRLVISEFLAVFPILKQQVDARYGAALRWLERLGFVLGEPAPFGPAGLPFVPATLTRRS